MMGKRGSPCMEYGGDADPGTEMLGISGDREHRIGRGLEQQIIDQRFVMIGDGGDLGRHREHDVEVADREKVGLAGLEPGARGGAVASWTVPVAPAVIRDPPVSAVGTGLDVTPERGSAAMLDRRHDIELMQAQTYVMSGAAGWRGSRADV